MMISGIIHGTKQTACVVADAVSICQPLTQLAECKDVAEGDM